MNSFLRLSALVFLVNIWVVSNAQSYILNEDFSSASGTTPPTAWSNNTITGTASDTDDLTQTICYYTLRNEIQNFCDDISCNLIEYLAKQIHNFITEKYGVCVKYLKLIKRPPMSNIETASFIIKG